MSGLIVRYGPAPDAEPGAIDARFVGFALLNMSADAMAELSAGPSLYNFAGALWAYVTKAGHGHMLIGAHDGFEYVGDVRGAGCGTSGDTENLMHDVRAAVRYRPKNYSAMLAVARSAGHGLTEAGHGLTEAGPDLAIDYRGTRGPGDLSIKPSPFIPDVPQLVPQLGPQLVPQLGPPKNSSEPWLEPRLELESPQRSEARNEARNEKSTQTEES